MQASRPIGIFDSGVGGLAVARVIKNLLPHEPIYYVGDKARLPYGEKSLHQLQSYTRAIGNWLLKQNCKAILIACNTATAAAAEQLQEQVGLHIPVLNVIDPVIAYIEQQYIGTNIGLIATNYTIQSQIYPQKLQALQADISLKTLPAPLLVPMVENNDYQADIVAQYLSDPQLSGIQALILGCTHYWFIKEQILQYYQHQNQHPIALIDGADLLAKSLQQMLEKRRLVHNSHIRPPDIFVATRLTETFQLMTQRLFGATVDLIKLPGLDD